tara:strand:+ start:87 stop:1889 length:1803 start_codon:yes stop_codon:yes gene_type:complete
MIDDVADKKVTELFSSDIEVLYKIPKYQRRYDWEKSHREKLFDDLFENDQGYFLGSIICIKKNKDSLDIPLLELVDGQQRMVTLSLLFAAIYTVLKSFSESFDENQKFEFFKLRKALVYKDETRLALQIEDNNYNDYCSILNELDLVLFHDQANNAGNRKITQTYRYYLERVKSISKPESNKTDIEKVFEFLEKVKRAVIIKIEVSSHSNANMLFESLNNRGKPLTTIDLIKNKLLAALETDDEKKASQYYKNWQMLLGFLGEEYSVQERFFRHYYNAFKDRLPIKNVSIATKSNLIKIYENLIDNNVEAFFSDLLQAGKKYSVIIGTDDTNHFFGLTKYFLDLERIQGAPSHQLLLYLIYNQKNLELSEGNLRLICDILIKFFARRNLTDTPATRDLDRIFIGLIDKVSTQKGSEVVNTVKEILVKVSASKERFEENLRGPIYDENAGVARFLLCSLEEKAMTDERQVDLWVRKGKNFAFTIEHIFPQGENIPNQWVDMIANGDITDAQTLQSKYVHKIGNLTLSGYNANLGNKSFKEKRDRTDQQKRPIGYKNGLYLNRELAGMDDWSVEKITMRTDQLVQEILDFYSFETEKVQKAA